MTEQTVDYQKLAECLVNSENTKQEVIRITMDNPKLSVAQAYRIQEALVSIKLEQGHRIIGPKMGLTSQAKMKQMGVDEPIYGYIFDYMVVASDGVIHRSELIHPKAEAEIAFIMGRDLEGPGITGPQVLAATAYVLPAIEIIDSRYEDFKFTLPDVIADNASSSRVVFGDQIIKPQGLDLELVGVTMSINGVVKALGAGAAVLGHPARAIAMLANMLAKKGDRIKAGEVILSGAITEALFIAPGDVVTVRIGSLGEVEFVVNE